MEDLLENIDRNRLPEHIAVIMDGNGRWAKSKGARRIFGHQNAIKAVREVTEGCAELGVSYLTLYAFSTENWQRPKSEVDALMELLVKTIHNEIPTLTKNNVRLLTIGEIESLPGNCANELEEAMNITSKNNGLRLVLALNYSGRWEILHAVNEILKEKQTFLNKNASITSEVFENYLHTSKMPDPELLIRTSGELRISNFLLWQLAYTELYFTKTLWPDFRKNHLYEAIIDYQNRERRFGRVLENA